MFRIQISARHTVLRTLVAVTALLCAFEGHLRAQSLSVTVSPNPAPLGATITVTATDASGQGLFTPGGCLVSSVRTGTPNGPTFRLFPCTFLPVAFPACGSTAAPRTATWNQAGMGGALATAGVYWFEISISVGMFGAITTEWHCVTIEGSTPGPVLSTSTSPTWGSVFPMALSAPAHAGENYIVALAQSTNSGISIPGGPLVCLDLDAIFALSFPSPDPLLFSGFQGVLDGAGSAGLILINIPPAAVGCLPLHAQAAVLSPAGAVTLSNDLHFTIQ